MKEVKRDDVIKLAKHVAAAGVKGVKVTRIKSKSETAWTAIYRIDFQAASWADIAHAMAEMSGDKKLQRSIGLQRGTQIVAYYERDPSTLTARMRKRFAGTTDGASLSAAERLDVSLNHAVAQAEEWEERYEHATVRWLLIYFR